MAALEHVNVTVRDPQATAALLGRLFGWTIRWQGASIHDGISIHVGTATQYVALYSGPGGTPHQTPPQDNYRQTGGLNHIGITVGDLDATEALVRAEGLTPHSHADYEPGRRFYFNAPDGVEYEVVSYA
jgi:catechol 2,3-dioxygenase-like lactoylglutathione lyase family enzyme